MAITKKTVEGSPDATAEYVYGKPPHGTRMDRMKALGEISAVAQSPPSTEVFIGGQAAKSWTSAGDGGDTRV